MKRDIQAFLNPVLRLESTQQTHMPKHSHSTSWAQIKLEEALSTTYQPMRCWEFWGCLLDSLNWLLQMQCVWTSSGNARRKENPGQYGCLGSQTLPPKIFDHRISRDFLRNQKLKRSSNEQTVWVEGARNWKGRQWGFATLKAIKTNSCEARKRQSPAPGSATGAASALVHLIYRINTAFRVIGPRKDLDSISIAVARA